MPDFSLKQKLYSRLLWFYRGVRRRVFRRTSELIPLMQQHLPSNPVLIEAGAHIGQDTIRFAELWPQGHIHAFEPIPALFAKLQQQVGGCMNVTCYSVALADQTGTARMFVSKGSGDGSSSLLRPKKHLDWHPNVEFSQEVIEVPAQTLDAWAAQAQITQLDALWLDLQGLELPVLQASAQTLQRVRVIVTEFADVELYAGQARYAAIRDWLKSQGFDCVYRERLWLYGGNAFFVRRESADRK